MKKNLLVCSILWTMLLLFSCQSGENEYEFPTAQETQAASEGSKVTAQEASDIALAFAGSLDRRVGTRSGQPRAVADVKALCSNRMGTRGRWNGLGIDTMFYVVNFAKNGGFALVAADKRATPVYALVNEGHWNVDSLMYEENEGFIEFLEGAEDAFHREREEHFNVPMPCDDDERYGGGGGGGGSPSDPGPWEIKYVKKPLLETKWGQGHADEPNSYGKYCPNKVTGCAITAAAQILSYYRTPGRVSWAYNTTYGETTLNWDRILADSRRYDGKLDPYFTPESMDEVAHLCRFLGVAFDANYKSKATGVDEGKPVKWFQKWSGLQATNFDGYNEGRIIDALEADKVIYARGNSIRKKILLFFNKYEGGHAWVYDGYLTAGNRVSSKNYVHCNWGWSGTSDGYYLSKCFDTKQGPEYPDKNSYENENGSHFKYRLQYSIISR